MPTVDLSVSLAGIPMKNPVMTASGTSGYGPEYAPYLDIASLGAFTTKAVTPEVRKGNPPPRTYETPGGMLNAIGLANVGLQRFLAEKVEYLREMGVPAIANVAGHTTEDYVTVCRALDEIDVISGLELNVSCPNVADGMEFGTDPARLEQLVADVRKVVKRAALIVKLSPNVTDIGACAQSAVNGGAEALSVINTIQAMAIHIDTWKPILANRRGGLSGPAIKPVAVRMVYDVYARVGRPHNIPIIGMGGIRNWRDAVEFHLAGATAVAVGTALFIDPTTPQKITTGLQQYLANRHLTTVTAIIGQAHHGDTR